MSRHVASRRRNAEATRAAILDAARERFARESYDGVGVRDLCRDVGVNAALVSRYFGSKADLFIAVLDTCENGAALIEGDRSTFGRRVANELIDETGSESKLKGLLVLLRSVGSTKAMELVRRAGNQRLFDPFAEWLGGPEAAVRARLAAGFVMGIAVSREISGGFGLKLEELKQMQDRMATILQDIVDN